MGDESEQVPPLPPDLLRDLRKAGVPGAVPSSVDRAILSDAHAAMGRRWRVRRLILAVSALSAAACVAVVGTLWWNGRGFDASHVNHDGQVTIVDAFMLAKRRAAGETGISQERIDQLAMRAVAVGPVGGRGAGRGPGGGGAP
jgi:hypothetical protein